MFGLFRKKFPIEKLVSHDTSDEHAILDTPDISNTPNIVDVVDVNGEHFLFDYDKATKDCLQKLDYIEQELQKVLDNKQKLKSEDFKKIQEFLEINWYNKVFNILKSSSENVEETTNKKNALELSDDEKKELQENLDKIKKLKENTYTVDFRLRVLSSIDSDKELFEKCKILSYKIDKNGKIVKNNEGNLYEIYDDKYKNNIELYNIITNSTNFFNDIDGKGIGRKVATINMSFAVEFNDIENIDNKVVFNSAADKLPVKIDSSSKDEVENYCKNIQQILKKNPKAKYIVGGRLGHAFLIEVGRTENNEIKLHIKDPSGAFTKRINESTGKTNYEYFLEHAKSFKPGIVFDTNETIQQMQNTQGDEGFCSYNELGLLKTCLDRDKYNNDIDEYNKDKDEKDKKPKLTDDEFEYNKAINILLHSSGKHMLSYKNSDLYEFNENGTRGKIPYNKIGQTIFKASLGDEESRNKINAIQNEEIRNNFINVYTKLEEFLDGKNPQIVDKLVKSDTGHEGHLNGVLDISYLIGLQEKANNTLEQELSKGNEDKIEIIKLKDNLYKCNFNVNNYRILYANSVAPVNDLLSDLKIKVENPDELTPSVLINNNDFKNLLSDLKIKVENPDEFISSVLNDKEDNLLRKNRKEIIREAYKMKVLDNENLRKILSGNMTEKELEENNEYKEIKDDKKKTEIKNYVNNINKIYKIQKIIMNFYSPTFKKNTEKYLEKLKNYTTSEYYKNISEEDKKDYEIKIELAEKVLKLERDENFKTNYDNLVKEYKEKQQEKSEQQTKKTDQQQVPLCQVQTPENTNRQGGQDVDPTKLQNTQGAYSKGHSQGK